MSNPNKVLLKSGLQKSRQRARQPGDTASVTKVLVTLNPNKVFHPLQPEANKEIETTFWDILEDMEQNGMEQIVGREPYIKEIETQDYNLEVGGKFHRIHGHFILTIKHYLEKYSLKKLQFRMQEWLNENGTGLVSPSKSWSVFLRTFQFQKIWIL